MKPKLLLVGGGGHCKSVIDVIEQQNSYNVIGCDKNLNTLFNEYSHAFVTVGQIKSSEIRIKLFSLLETIGFNIPIIISPRAYISRHAIIGKGSVVMHDALINANAIIGENCIINSKALIEHDTKVEDHCHISTGAILNGNVSIGSGCFIGSGSIVKQGISIEKECLIGMSLSIRNNLPKNSKFTGHNKI